MSLLFTSVFVVGGIVYYSVSTDFQKKYDEKVYSNIQLLKENHEFKQKINTLVNELSKFDNVDISKYMTPQSCTLCQGIICHTCKHCNRCKESEERHSLFSNITMW